MAPLHDAKFMTPALSAYIQRIGAQQINFRKFMVKIYKGKYYYERTLIELKQDGTIYCNNSEHEPTKEERAEIESELKKVISTWPKSEKAVNTSKLKLPPIKDAIKSTLFEFWDRSRSHIIMCQQRVDRENGDKDYYPWTFFDDGKWRSMDPDGNLPFWKPKVARNKCKIMIHEGAKAAAFIDGLINDPKRRAELKTHPWGEQLSEYEHWGMIGGALAPHRTDYKELRDENATEVIYVCDNDHPGKEALEKVSKEYERPLKGIIFGNKFRESFDMADPVPDPCPSLDSLKCFATYATEYAKLPKGSKGRPPLVLKSCFAQEWVHCVCPDVYIHKDWPNRILKKEDFDDQVRPFSGSKTTSDLVKSCRAIKAQSLKYDPSKPSGFYGEDWGHFNTYCPGPLKEVKGDYEPFLDFMKRLFPVEYDRFEVMRWMATLIARPDIRMMYALLLISETQGVGKTTLASHIMRPIVGEENTESPGETEIIDQTYTYWVAHKRLIIVNEIYAGHNQKAYDNLKTLITDPTVTVKKKFLDNYEIDNWIQIIACSNNYNALKITGDDRRWLIPRVTEEKESEEYWSSFRDWLYNHDGHGKIIHWAKKFLEKNKHVGRGENAPMTTTKGDVIDENNSEGQQIAQAIFMTLKERADRNDGFHRCVLMDKDVQDLIKDVVHEGKSSQYLERTSTIRKAARRAGWHISSVRTRFASDMKQGWLICSRASDARMRCEELFREVIPTRITRLRGRILTAADVNRVLSSIDPAELADFRAAERQRNDVPKDELH